MTLKAADIRTVAELPFAAAEAYGEHAAQLAKRDGVWVERSFRDLADTVRGLARGLVDAGVSPGQRVCLLAETRPEWSDAGLAVLVAGAVLVPIYPSNSPEECEWVLSNSGARLVICENADQLAKVEQVRARLLGLAGTVVIDGGGLERLAAVPADRVAALDAELERRRASIDPTDPSLIIYTSGTTGPPKGCVLTHHNWITLCAVTEELSYITPDDVVYLFLPLAHVFAQIVQFACLYAGATLAYFGGDIRRIVPELAEVRPTFLPSVPRIFEKLYTALTGAVDPATLTVAVRAGLTAQELRRAGQEVPAELAAVLAAAEPLFSRVRAIFGGRLRMALSGAAPIAVPVLELFSAAGVPVLEGYSMTETSGVGTVSTIARHRFGTVGVAAPHVELRIAEDGEVLVRGPNLFAGYWRDRQSTVDTFAHGWLRTGDLGELDADGFLTITGRKKDIIITAGGKNVAHVNLENDLRQSRWISHALVYGDRRPYLVALLSFDADEVLPWAKERGLPEDVEALAGHPAVLALLQEVVDGVNARYARVEHIKKFAILPRDLTQAAGELTPTLKVKRAVVHSNHAALLTALYDDGGDDGRR